jgi:hypothetical protein
MAFYSCPWSIQSGREIAFVPGDKHEKVGPSAYHPCIRATKGWLLLSAF